LQPNGVERIHPLGEITKEEKVLVSAAVPELQVNISTGANFILEAGKSAL
jgi:malate dehydrogenase